MCAFQNGNTEAMVGYFLLRNEIRACPREKRRPSIQDKMKRKEMLRIRGKMNTVS
jgi:hypothetical protein